MSNTNNNKETQSGNNKNKNNNNNNNIQNENNFNSPNDGENINNNNNNNMNNSHNHNISDRISQYSSSEHNIKKEHNRNGSNTSIISASNFNNFMDENSTENNRLSQRPAPAILNIIQSLIKNPTDDANGSKRNTLEGIVKKYPSFKSLDGSSISLSQSQSSMDSSPLTTSNSKSPNHHPQPSPNVLSRSSCAIDSPSLNSTQLQPTTTTTTTTTTTSSPSLNNKNNNNKNNNNNNSIDEGGCSNDKSPSSSSYQVNNNNKPKNNISRLELPTSLRSSNNAMDSSAAPSSNTSRPQFSQPQSEVPSSCSPPGNGLLRGTIEEKEESTDNFEKNDNIINHENNNQSISVTVNICENQLENNNNNNNNNSPPPPPPQQSTMNDGDGGCAAGDSFDTTESDHSISGRRMTKMFSDAPIKEYQVTTNEDPLYSLTTTTTTTVNNVSINENKNTPSSPSITPIKLKQPKPDEDEELSIKNKKQASRQTVQLEMGTFDLDGKPNEQIVGSNSSDETFEGVDVVAIDGDKIVGRDRAFSSAMKESEVVIGEQTVNVDLTQEDMDNINFQPPNTDPPPPQPLTSKQILIIFSGLMVSLFLSSLDMTIVATALPAIVADLHGLEQLPWVVTIYLLTSTSVSPLFGKFSDIFGKKILLLSSLIIFLIGSLLCAVATTMNMLILARAIQGIGGGGLMSAVMIVMAEIVPLRDRGKYQGLLGAVYAVSSVVGPLMGGTFTDNITWRWAFWINLPLGAVAFVVVFFALKIPQKVIPWREGIKKVDVVGSLSLVAATISFLLALNWGGIDYPWTSPIIICLFIGTALFVALFIVNEKYWFNVHPIIPLDLFKTRNYVLCSIGSFLLGFVMFGVIYYIPLYFQYVRGATATASGLQLLPTMLGIVLFGAISGLLITRFGHYKSYPIIGMGFMMIGIYLISLWNHESTQNEFIGYQCFIGVGIGLTMQILVLIVQNSVNVIYISISTATVSFFRTIGGVVSVSVFSAILNQQFSQNLNGLLEKDAFVLGGMSPHNFNMENLKHIKNPIHQQQIRDAYQSALSIVFLSAAPFAGLGCILILFVKNQKLRTTMITQKDKDQEILKKNLEKLQKELHNDDSIDINEEYDENENNEKCDVNINEIENNNNNNTNNNTNNNDIELDIQTPPRKSTIST
ncbi:hypothetical protein ACTFIR_010023 [Dictyostelium discoideum]